MQPHDLAIPILPCRSVEETVAFYRQVGFTGGPHEFNREYVILLRGDLELHFFLHSEVVPTDSHAGCYLRVANVEAIHAAFASAHLPTFGVPRMDRLEDKPWGLREFAVVDPSGNLLRIGQVITK